MFIVTGFSGALVFTAAAAMLHLSEDVFGWIAAGIVTSRAGERAGVIGAAALAIGHVLSPESIDALVG